MIRAFQLSSFERLSSIQTWWASLITKWQEVVIRSSAVFMFMGFFLGRAEIIGELSPFAIALYAVVLRLRKSSANKVMIAVVAGTMSSQGIGRGLAVLGMLVLYRLIFATVHRKKSVDLNVLPFIVFLVNTGSHVAFAYGTAQASPYVLIMGLLEGFLAMVLTLIFIQSIPIFTFQRGVKELRNEEIFALVILMASMLTGFAGLYAGNLSFENIFSRYLIMLFALIGGAGIGSSLGVVTGMILALSSLPAVAQIGLLGFSGMLGGLLRDMQKFGVGLGFALGTAITAVYTSDMGQVLVALEETLVALAVLWITPRSLVEQISKYVPGTHQHRLSQQDYARRVRELMAVRIREVSSVFEELSHTFAQITTQVPEDDETVNRTLDRVVKEACNSCVKRQQCWDKDFYPTYQSFLDTIAIIERTGPIQARKFAPDLRNRCIRLEQMVPVLNQAVEITRRDAQWSLQLLESRELVAGQLSGVSRIMGELAQEIKRENYMSADNEEHIIAALEQLGLSIRSVDIISLDEGKVEIEVTQTSCGDHDECTKMIAPLLSEIVGENITVAERSCGLYDDYCLIRFTSAKVFQVQTGVASTSKEGGIPCGDSYTTLDVGNGKYAVAVSDGMGNGERAMQESSAAIRLLQQLLKAGFDEQVAIKSVNSVLLLRSKEEIFTTMDLALIDLFTAKTEFLKIGSVPSFIKRAGHVMSITGQNVPIGILQDIDIQTVEADLEDGDLLILMSDGIYDAPKHVLDKEDWLKRQIERMETDDPQVMSDMLLELAVRVNQGKITDDMTVMVARIEKYHPEWATIKLPGMKPIRRKPAGSGNKQSTRQTQVTMQH